MNYLLQAINKATHTPAPMRKIAEKRQFSSLHSLFSEVFAEMADYHGECYVVLDDYHLIHDETIHEANALFLKAHAR